MAAKSTKLHDRVVFLDRDGVVNCPPPKGSWVFSWEEFRFADSSLEALRRLHENGFTVIVITNQSCIGRGLATFEQIEAINRRMAEAVAEAGGRLAGVYMCPHPKDADCSCRKPKAGLIDQAARELGVRPERAFLIGDSQRDIVAGLARGCTTIFVTTGQGDPAEGSAAHHVVADLAQAVDLLVKLVEE